MKKYLLIISAILFSYLFGCQKNEKEDLREKSKKEIVQTEKEFEDMAAEKGVAQAFYYFAADSAAMGRKNSVIVGREEILKYYEKWTYKNVVLKWAPDFVDAAESGEIGYTYGKAYFSALDSTGNKIESNHYFHTVWKKQPDGKWKFVWD